MKVFVVTSGEYSDYRIDGIFSTEEKAKEGKKFYNADNPIYEEEIDSLPKHPKGMFWFEVEMTEQGEARRCKIENGSYSHEDLWRPYGDDDCVTFYMWARDEKHAVKIANERRTQLIAMNLWTTDWAEWKRRKDEDKGSAKC